MRIDLTGGNPPTPYNYVAPHDEDEPRPLHPAIPSYNDLQRFIRAALVLGALCIVVTFLGACTVVEHRDGNGYTIRYVDSPEVAQSSRATPRPRKIAPKTEPTAVAAHANARDKRESHPVLNVGQDDEIPTEYRHYVSDRSLRTIRARMAMCRQSRPGYCNPPNTPHCHGPFCHAHAGGERRHTH